MSSRLLPPLPVTAGSPGEDGGFWEKESFGTLNVQIGIHFTANY